MDGSAIPYLIFKLCLYGSVFVLWRLAERDAREVREKLEGDPVERALIRAQDRSDARAGRKRRWRFFR